MFKGIHKRQVACTRWYPYIQSIQSHKDNYITKQHIQYNYKAKQQKSIHNTITKLYYLNTKCFNFELKYFAWLWAKISTGIVFHRNAMDTESVDGAMAASLKLGSWVMQFLLIFICYRQCNLSTTIMWADPYSFFWGFKVYSSSQNQFLINLQAFKYFNKLSNILIACLVYLQWKYLKFHFRFKAQKISSVH